MSRVYSTRHKPSDSMRLVRANNKAQALRFVAEAEFSVVLADQEILINALGAGAKVEDATKTPEPASAF